MKSTPSTLLRRLLQTTQFWQDNGLIFREARYFPGIATIAIAAPILAAVFEGFGIGFLLGFLQNLVDPNGEPFQTGLQWFDVWILGIDQPELNRLYRVSALILCSTWMRALFNYLTFLYTDLAKARLVDRLYTRVFEQLQAVSLSFFNQVRSGDIINTLTTEINQLQQMMRMLGFIVSKGLVVLVYAVVALLISWQLSLLTVLLFGLAIAGLSNLHRRVREASFPVSRTRSKFTSLASELVSGIRTVKAFATQDYEQRRYSAASQDIVKAAKVAAQRLSLVRPMSEGLATTILVMILLVGMTLLVGNGLLEVPALLTFVFILFRMVPALHELNGDIATIQSLQGAMHSIQNLLRTDDKPYQQNGHLPFTQIQRAIQLVSVDFGYAPDSPVLKNLTLTIEKGQTIALVGASGAGKSTLVDLLPRFYDPTEGAVLIDGIDLRQFDINTVRRNMAIVSQDTFIFNTSVRDNIAYGSEGASHDEVLEAARLANAVDFVDDLPDGFDTVLGDRGVRLSGGQRQRIAIARALLRNPEILILDEATSALDSMSEKLIQASVEKLSVGRTVIAIAHRLSTIVNADKVVVLDQGRIVEQGSYQDLLNHRGYLWKFHQMQYEVGQAR
ncbi:MAG: heterocyst formation ABC transporter subunit HepA [Cyanobacteria bacterium J06635_15]